MTPTATGCARRNHRATKATAPSAKSTAIASPLWSAQVATSTSALRPAATPYSARSTTQSRAERRPSTPPRSSPGSSMRCQRGSVAWSLARGRHGLDSVRTARGSDPRPKSTRTSTPGRGGEGPRRRSCAAMIDSEGLTKRYDGRSVIEDVTFRCEPGTVTGFLGPNGAGKTTTMRVLCGLSDPDAGRATVLGGHYRDLPNPGRRVGVLLDASAQHPGRRGRETLAVSAQTIGVRRAARRRPARARRARSLGGAQARAPVLAGHAPAPRARARAARRPRGPDPRRAGQRPGPRGDALDARAAARVRRPRRHGAALLAPARRGPGRRRSDRDHRRGAHRRPGQPRRAAGRRRHARGGDRRGGAGRRAARRRPAPARDRRRRLRRRRGPRSRRTRRARRRRRAHPARARRRAPGSSSSSST